jgi:transposase InsO family protein
MNIHENARTTPRSRLVMMERLDAGWKIIAVASCLGIDARTVRKWRDRYRSDGPAGLRDRSSRPRRCPSQLDARVEDQIVALRRMRLSGPVIARRLSRPISTVGKVLRRCGLGRLSALDQHPPIIRYEREKPGDLIHVDTKKLGRVDGVGHRITGDRARRCSRRSKTSGPGWEALHVAIDDASRLAYTEILPDETKTSAIAFLTRAIAFFKHHGVNVQRLMTDNGAAYKSKLFGQALSAAGIIHKRTRPYTPRTNGKAERFIQTSLREWIYATSFENSSQRTDAMRPWLYQYNNHRPHSALGGKPPISRIEQDNLRGNDS